MSSRVCREQTPATHQERISGILLQRPRYEERPTEIQTKNKKRGIRAFFKRTWQAVKCADRCRHRGNKVVPLQPETDPDDLLIPPESTAPRDPDLLIHSQAQSSTESPAHPDADLASQSPIPGDAQRTWQAVKCADRCRHRGNNVVPFQPETDPDDLLSPPESMAPRDPDDPQPGSSSTEAAAHPDADRTGPNPVPGASGLKMTSDRDPAESPFLSLYEVGNKISAGMFGSVFQGIRKSDRKQVAIKFIQKRKIDKYIHFAGYSKPLLMEVALNLLLKKAPLSPNIVYMLEWFEEEDQHILILEHPRPCLTLLGLRLDCKHRTLDETQARGLMFQAVLAAKHCIDQGVFHRDIKPSNVLVNTETMEVKLIDFGSGDLVKQSGYQYEFRGRHRPPEFYTKRRYHAGPTTVWTLGIMLYQLVTGRQAFRTEEEIIAGDLAFDSSLSKECQEVISQCLIRDPDDRATLEQLLDHKWFQQEDDPAVDQGSGGVT
ncbi:serine/threonine-protein kinase pim-1-like [Puntigrus tetrazona]|uniref:serine/threonine-protein kinase pim-1-like n=1 Tax=Puntigrus tetrazona TaxID=1606681 RepID=UPI001C88FA3C|nr:serine/threonine-protein kinase pim-1-like [Puntigrus tetrazona]